MSPLVLIILAVIGAGVAAFFVFGASPMDRRMKMVTEREKPKERGFDLRHMLFGSDDSKDLRRRQVQESVSQLEERTKVSNRRKSLQDLLDQAGIGMAISQFRAIAAGRRALAVVAFFAVGKRQRDVGHGRASWCKSNFCISANSGQSLCTHFSFLSVCKPEPHEHVRTDGWLGSNRLPRNLCS